ncbi:MAG: FAD-dependent oxidoreductase [Candidatus Omnitrophica bacterium]|nr:FAD-dependent oxidoreductase [Candidatus Omnitrophota bacterium]
MNEFKLKFIERIKRTETTESFRFSSEKRIEFCPGQFLKVLFDGANKNNKDLNKYLSFSCAPSKEYIEVTKRRSESEFSKRLWSLKKDDIVSVEGPIGSCTFDSAYQKVAFITGGIGITPAISIIEYIVENKIPSDIKLLYSNMTEDDIPFRQELESWEKDNPNFNIAWTLAEGESEEKKFFKGLIDKDFILKNITDYKDRSIFISGPPKMVEAMKKICVEIGCEAGKVKAENFVGY